MSAEYIIDLIAFNNYSANLVNVHHQLLNQPSIKPIYYEINNIINFKYIDATYFNFHTLIENLNYVPKYNYTNCKHDSDSEEDYCDNCIEPIKPTIYQIEYIK